MLLGNCGRFWGVKLMEIDKQLVFQVLRKGEKNDGEGSSPPHFKTVTSLFLTGDGASVAAVLLLVFTEGFDKRNTF